mgnify:CR=1 FL=1
MGDKILIIDQSHHFMEMLTVRLLNYGYDKFRTARTGKDGLRIVDLEEPNLVVIDTCLPDTSGYRLCQQIKELHGDKIKVLLMTGLAERYHLEKAVQVCADEYVIKTYDCLFLMAAIKRLLSRERHRHLAEPFYNSVHN